MGKLNKTPLLEETIGGKTISVLADRGAIVPIISANWLNNFGDGGKCAQKSLKESIKLMSFWKFTEDQRTIVQLEFTTSGDGCKWQLSKYDTA